MVLFMKLYLFELTFIKYSNPGGTSEEMVLESMGSQQVHLAGEILADFG